MTEKKLTDLVRIWTKRLGLGGWEIGFQVKPGLEIDGSPVFMRMERSVYYDRGMLYVDPGIFDPASLPSSIDTELFKTMVPEEYERWIEASVIHELLHLILRDLVYAGDLVREQLSKVAVDVWDEAWRRAEESTVERLAHALQRMGSAL